MRCFFFFAGGLLGQCSAVLSAQPVSQPITLLTGTLTSTGSDTLAALMSGW